MRTHQTLSHTADIRLRVEADNLPELFVAAIEGMTSILKAQSEKHGRKFCERTPVWGCFMTLLIILLK